MRVAFIAGGSRKVAQDKAPWACKMVKVTGGFLAFESWPDYDRRKQYATAELAAIGKDRMLSY